MNAREIALSKIKDKTDKEKEARRIEADNKVYLTKQGKKLAKQVAAILEPFKEDFTIKAVTDTKKESSYGWYYWEFSKPAKNRLFYVLLQYETHSGKFSDDTPEVSWDEWYITVQVPVDVYDRKFRPYYNYKGDYSYRFQTSTYEDFSCSKMDELETRFGEYMARWY